MKRLNKTQQANQKWLIDNYKDEPGYTLFTCGDHGAFAQKLPATGICTHCGKPGEHYKA